MKIKSGDSKKSSKNSASLTAISKVFKKFPLFGTLSLFFGAAISEGCKKDHATQVKSTSGNQPIGSSQPATDGELPENKEYSQDLAGNVAAKATGWWLVNLKRIEIGGSPKPLSLKVNDSFVMIGVSQY